MPAIGAERQVALDHRLGETGGDRLLAEREMAGALDQVLQEQVVGALLSLTQPTCDRYSARRLASPISSFSGSRFCDL